jgi:predicted nuclease of predicted toxin-antitoxin system
MSLSILIDMNLSAEWVQLLEQAGWSAVHWSSVRAVGAEDQELMAWATTHKHVVFTHDLDFGSALALTHASAPSVVQLRGQRVLPEQVGPLLLAALRQYETELGAGALIVIEESKSRVRILPF